MIVGIDLGGTKIAAVLLDDKGKVVRETRVPTHADEGRAVVIGQLREALREVTQGVRPRAIGVGVPGLYKGARILKLPNVPALDGIDIRSALGARCRVALENDARCFLLAEYRMGAAKGKRNVIGVTLGTGVGGAIIIDGQLYHGRGGAGEFGHMIWNTEARRFRTGEHQDDWEALLRGPAIIALHHAHGGHEEQASDIWKSASVQSHDTRRRIARYLAIYAAGLLSAFDPELVVVGGGVANATLVREANALLPHYGWRPCLKLATLGSRAGVLGAALLVRE